MDKTENLEALWPESIHGRWMSMKYEKDLVSVIIPTYNRAERVTDAIESVWRQTYRPIELFVVDDGSVDNTSSVVEKWIGQHAHDPKFKTTYLFQTNNGAPAARNRGLIESQGEFIQLLDSDDLLLPEKISKQIEKIESGDFHIVYSPNKQIDSSGNFIKYTRTTPPTKNFKDYVQQRWQTMCALYKRIAIFKIGPWNEKLTIYQDYEYSIRAMTLFGNKVGFLNVALQIYIYHSAERIGGQKFVYSTVKSKEYALISLCKLLHHKQLMSNKIKKAYFRKFLLCIILYGLLKANEDKKRVWRHIQKEKLCSPIISLPGQYLLPNDLCKLLGKLFHVSPTQ